MNVSNNILSEARYWTTTGSGGLIDRDTIKKGVQLGFGDLSKEFNFTVRDPITGNSCWSHGIIRILFLLALFFRIPYH